MGNYNAVLEEEACTFLAEHAFGDARVALNALELAILSTNPSATGEIRITKEVVAECMQEKLLRYDGESEHYDTIPPLSNPCEARILRRRYIIFLKCCNPERIFVLLPDES